MIGFDALKEPDAGWIGKLFSFCHTNMNDVTEHLNKPRSKFVEHFLFLPEKSG